MPDAVNFEKLNIRVTQLLKEQTHLLSEASDFFHTKETREPQDYIDLLQSIILSTDAILTEVQAYKDKPFFLPTLQSIEALRSEVRALLARFLEEGIDKNKVKFLRRLLQEEERRVYVSLFQNDENNLSKWVVQLHSLGSYLSGRPIYQSEADVMKFIRSRPNPISYAFVSLILDKKYIQNSVLYEKRRDSLGSLLLFIDNKHITSENVEEFVHGGKRYILSDKRLLLRESNE